jgi:catechol 2,3-dioxygenase
MTVSPAPSFTTRPADAVIAAGTAMDAVTLLVGDLDRMITYYRDVLALAVLDVASPDEHQGTARTGATVTLGRAGVPIVILRHTPDLPPAARGQAGLFHTAILFDDREGLAAAVASLAAKAPSTFVGSADHLVSLAFYFTDPEGNGIELYWDRSRSLWTWDGNRVRMDTLPLDPNAFLGDHLTDAGAERPGDAGASVGHVHLQVGDVALARDFYVGALGFEVTASWHGALFVSAGGYHHHLAMNSWNSAGAGPRASALGLGEVALAVPTADDVAALTSRLARHMVPVRNDGATLAFEDPWRNLIRVSVAG